VQETCGPRRGDLGGIALAAPEDMSFIKLFTVAISIWAGALAFGPAPAPLTADGAEVMPTAQPDGGLPRLPDMAVHAEHTGAALVSE